MSLRYGSSLRPPQADLHGYFEVLNTSSLFRQYRYLTLRGSILTYRHHEHGRAIWRCDLRESRVMAGCNARELIVERSEGRMLRVLAERVEDMKEWFITMKRVGEGLYSFYTVGERIGETKWGGIYKCRDKKEGDQLMVHELKREKMELEVAMMVSKRDEEVILASREHVNVLSVVDVMQSADKVYVVTEVGEEVGKGRSGILGDVLRGMHFLHSRGILCGDLTDRIRVSGEVGKIVIWGGGWRDVRLMGKANVPEGVWSEKADVYLLGKIWKGDESILKGMLEREVEKRWSVKQCLDFWIDGVGRVDGGRDPDSVVGWTMDHEFC